MQRVEILSDTSFNAIITSNGLIRATSVISGGEEIILSTCHADEVNYFDCVVVESPELTSEDGSKFGKISGYSFVQGNFLCFVQEFMVGGNLSSLLEDFGYFEHVFAAFYAAESIHN